MDTATSVTVDVSGHPQGVPGSSDSPLIPVQGRSNSYKARLAHQLEKHGVPTPEGNKTWEDFFVNHGTQIFCLLALAAGNAACLAVTAASYTLGEHKAVTDAIGVTVPMARATATAIKLNSALILLTVLRNFLSWVRGTWVGSYLPVDQNISLHKLLAWLIMFFATIHVVAHCVNFYKIAYVVDPTVLIQLGLLQPGQTPPTPWQAVFSTLPGATGVVIVITMWLMYVTAASSARRPMFEFFWFTHHLFVIYYVVTSVHGASALLEPPTFWCWIIGPLVLYLIERIVRIIRGSQKTIVLKAISHPSRVIEVRLKKATFKYHAGQYVFLQCPYLAEFEWHPFTISSSPDEDFMSCHIRNAGDWTGALVKLLNPESKLGVVQSNMISAPNGKPIFLVDGPFGTASEEVWKYEYVSLWAAGIGVTPFASILKSIRFQIKKGSTSLKKVQFYWINREQTEFEWFIDLLVELSQSCPYLEINLFFTGRVSAAEVTKAMKGGAKVSLGHFLQQTTFARPDIPKIFEANAQTLSGKKVGVFFCGPPAIARQLQKACEGSTDSSLGTKFVFHKENF